MCIGGEKSVWIFLPRGEERVKKNSYSWALLSGLDFKTLLYPK
jgi:hypothetical protein